jgi:predicted RNA-binding Zn-ribbon protein involved in translation (DUF1610 family)
LSDVLTFHEVPQARFAANPHAEFDLDVRAEEGSFFAMRQRSGFAWDELVKWGRGIEIGKEGLIYRCPSCGTARAHPKSPNVRCAQCGEVLGADSAEQIVRPLSARLAEGWEPLIVGSDVVRYRASPSRQIRVGVPGVAYKSGDAQHRKLLVRKTGIGIQAAVDETGAQTVQSVFHCIARLAASAETLDFLLGVLNSRLIQAYHLRVTGDHEWRSHPYVTPRVLRSLPVPDSRDSRRHVAQIARLAHRLSQRYEARIDARLDDAVAELYGIGHKGVEWSHQVLAEAEQLRAIARLAVPKQLRLDGTAAD